MGDAQVRLLDRRFASRLGLRQFLQRVQQVFGDLPTPFSQSLPIKP
jgi:hypothetical protein